MYIHTFIMNLKNLFYTYQLMGLSAIDVLLMADYKVMLKLIRIIGKFL